MKVNEKVFYVTKAIEGIATHDDAPVEEVVAALKAIVKYATEAIKDVLKRRVGDRFVAYFKRLVGALVGK